MKKSFFAQVFLILLLLIFATACGGQQSNTSSKENTNGSEATAGNKEETNTKIDFPTKPITIIVPYAPGGTTDTASRTLASVISKYIPNGVSVNVVNKPGGGGIIGMTEVLKAKPDGYTIGMATVGPMTIKPHTDNTAYGADTFKPIMEVVATPNVLVVQSDAPWATYDEWFEYVKANPGAFNFGTTGAGLTQHITMESFSVETGVKLTHIPFDGGAPTLAALLGGHVDGAVVQTTEAMPHIQSGKLRALVNTGSFKTEGLEDVPLLTEKGVNVSSDVWTGLVAPPEVPDEIIDILHQAFKQALEDESLITKFKNIGVTPSYAGPEKFQEIIKRDFDINGKVLKAAGIIK